MGNTTRDIVRVCDYVMGITKMINNNGIRRMLNGELLIFAAPPANKFNRTDKRKPLIYLHPKLASNSI